MLLIGKGPNKKVNIKRMKSLAAIILTFFFVLGTTGTQTAMGQSDKTIFVYGNGMEKTFIKYVAELTHKKKPRICFITTASADHPGVIQYLQELVADIDIKPSYLISFISSSPEQESFEDLIMNSDAIMVGGGNTLNMLGIWKAQGIDTLLRQAYEKGIILAGGSAGSLCWFNAGYSDSRPKKLTIIECLGFLNYSHAPHYNDQPERRPLYQKAVLEGKLSEGYACDAGAGLLFKNGSLAKSVALDKKNYCYFVSVKDGKLSEQRLRSEIIR
jgi:dipeptidase E